MNKAEVEELTDAFASVIRQYVGSAVQPLLARLADLEARLAKAEARAANEGTGEARAMRAEIGKGLG